MHPCEEKKDGCKEFLTLPRIYDNGVLSLQGIAVAWGTHILELSHIVALLRPQFSAPLTPNNHIFFIENRWLSLSDPLCFLSICHPKPVIF